MDTDLVQLAKLVRYYSLTASTAAGSGHPTSSLSAADLMTVLFFKHLRYDLKNPDNIYNDRVIFSKGHASPLFYALYTVAGAVSEPELLKYRTFESPLEGHPTPRFKYTEAATGSLGQGLSIGVGETLALRAKISNFKFQISNFPKVYVLLGDGEMAEGSVWEALEIASHYKLNNLIAILDVNRLGQSEPTMLGADIDVYANRVAAFGWRVLKVPDGHDIGVIDRALQLARQDCNQPTMIIAKTIKGKGFSLWEDKNGWHSKTLKPEQLKQAIHELGPIDKTIKGIIQKPTTAISNTVQDIKTKFTTLNSGVGDQVVYDLTEQISTKKAFGNAIERLGQQNPELMVLDGDVKNSLHTDQFEKKYPNQFLQMYIAEQNMVGVAIGLAKRGFKPWVTTFACFLTRAHDQLRMAALSEVTILFNGSYAGVSVGLDGPSQMGLDDISLFRGVLNSVVVYPGDAYAAERLTETLLKEKGISYIRTSRPEVPIIYKQSEDFPLGGSKTFAPAQGVAKITVIAAGVTLHEALKAQKELAVKQIPIGVIDCYSIKPIDRTTLLQTAQETRAIITVEDHYAQGGLGEAVLEALADAPRVPIYKLAVTKMPRSGKPGELLDYEGISARAIVEKVSEIVMKG